jgi:ABC-type amino acid transport substrate-binding protein
MLPATPSSHGRSRTTRSWTVLICIRPGLVWAAPLRKDSGELRKTLDVAVECMKLDGTIAKMHEKWFGVAPAAVPPR